MKIKTLTTYNVYNYGASLQAYALQTYLSKLGHDVEIINFNPHYLTRKYDYKWVNPESKMSRFTITRFIYRILKFLQRQTTLKRKSAFDQFTHHTLRETKQRYLSFDELKKHPPEADLYIAGSDQIWNIFYEAGRDPSFYLDFVKQGKKASYAASFSYLEIDDNNKSRISKSLKSFNGVSVREYHGLEILKDMEIEGSWVLDPVFLLNTNEWIKIMTEFRLTEEYLLIYDFENNKELEIFAKAYAQKYKLKIFAIVDTYPIRYADKNFKDAGPREFLTMIYHCKAFISNSFHGTALSIIFHKPVFVFPRHRHKVNSRMESLLVMFELRDCLLDDMQNLNRMLEYKFNYEKIESIQKKYLSSSKQFIDTLL